jgi:[acyl-carrier-protein] S-malonyltransferase
MSADTVPGVAAPRSPMEGVAFLYAGQGSQKAGMGRDLRDAHPAFRRAFEAVDPSGDIARLCFDATQEELSLTHNTQPAMVAFSIAVTALLDGYGIRPMMAAGLSLGEYSALCAAGVLEPLQAAELVRFRGSAMERATRGRACGMAAVLGLGSAEVADICRRVREGGVGTVEPANINGPRQIVISGDGAAVACAAESALEAGALRCVPLQVSGAFHTSLMRSAGDELRERFATERFGSPWIPVVFNATGTVLQPGQTVPGLLERQVQSSVLFHQTVQCLVGAGVRTVIEVGPGRVLSKLVRKIDQSLEVLNVEDEKSLVRTLKALEGGRRA